MGVAFPIGLRVWAGRGADETGTIARRIGQFYTLNVSGAIAGSLAGGFVLLPWFGSRASLAILATTIFGSGLLLLAVSELRRRSRLAAGSLAAILFAAAIVASPDPFAQFLAVRFPRERIVWRDEGVEATVVVHESPRRDLSLTINGNHQASTDASTTYVHRRIGHLPRRVLNPGGMVVQWVAGTDAEYKMIARAFLSVFPETTVWGDGSLLVGTLEPLRLSRSAFERKLRTPGGAEGLHDLDMESFERLRAAFTAGPEELRAFVGPGPVLTDDKPLVEYFLSLPRDRDVDTSSLKGDVNRYVTGE